jgi:hypothetical protein
VGSVDADAVDSILKISPNFQFEGLKKSGFDPFSIAIPYMGPESNGVLNIAY